MLLIEPATTPFDLHFSIFGFPVRISGWFWIGVLVLGGGYSDGAELVAWVTAVFLSIVIHELGHAVAYRWYGVGARIVLYQFGGLAIADGFSTWKASGVDRDPRRQIVISLAGPVAQIAGALVLMIPFATVLMARQVPFASVWEFAGGVRDIVTNQNVFAFLWYFTHVSVIWALMNLLPVFPLDGGKVSQSLFLLYGGAQAMQHTYMLSLFVGGAAAIYGFTHDQPFLGLMFGMLAYSSYQVLEQYRGGGWR